MKKSLKLLLWVLLIVMSVLLVVVFTSATGCSKTELAEEVVEESEEETAIVEEHVEGKTIVEEVIDIDEFIGSWRNLDPDTGSITKVQIRMENNEIFIHMWGKCHPEDCDWGEEKPESYDSKSRTIFMTWKTGFSIISQQINLLYDGNLQVSSHTHFIDESNRADYDSLDIFYKKSEETTKKELELLKGYSLFISEVTQADYSVNGIVEEISGRNLTITEFTDNEEIEEASSLVVQG